MLRIVSSSRFLTYYLGFLTIAASLLIGSVHTEIQGILSTLAIFSFLITLMVAKSGRKLIFLPISFFLLMIIVLWSAFQLIPLPQNIIKIFSPHLYDIYDRVGISTAAPLAYDPPAVILEICKFAGYSAILFGGYILGRNRSGRAMIKFIAYGGTLLAIIALVHYFLKISDMYGVYSPKQSKVFLIPFVNSNHASGYYIFILFLLSGLALDEPNKRLGHFTWVMAIFPFTVVIISGSRGGLFALGAGIILFMSLYYSKMRGSRKNLIYLIILILLISAVPLMEKYVKPFSLDSDSHIDSDVKVKFWKNSLPLMKDHLYSGIGKGSFNSVFPHYLNVKNRVLPRYSENVIIQQIVDLGFPVFFFILSISLYLMVRFFRKIKYRPWKIGAITAVIAIFVQNIVDFNLEFPGTAFGFFLVIGVLSAQKFKKKTRSRLPKIKWKPIYLLLFWIAISVPMLWSLYSYALPKNIYKEQKELVELYQSKNFVEMRAKAVAAQKRHVSDYFITTSRGIAEMHLKEGTPLKWIGLASWLFPRNYFPELAAARLMVRWHFMDQARLQYKRAFLKGAPIKIKMVNELRKNWKDLNLLMSMIPDNKLIFLRRLLSKKDQEPVCRRIVKKGYDYLPCIRLLCGVELKNSRWKELLLLSDKWLGMEDTNMYAVGIKMRALFELNQKDKLIKWLKALVKDNAVNGIIIATYGLLSTKNLDHSMVEKEFRILLRRQGRSLKTRYYILKAMDFIQMQDINERFKIKQRIDQLANLGRIKRDKKLEILLKPLWKKNKP